MCLTVGVHNFYPTLCIILQGMKVKLKVRAEGLMEEKLKVL